MHYRTFDIADRGLNAHGFFSRYARLFSGLLEDPKGNGRAFLVSRQGTSHRLTHPCDERGAEQFLQQWRRDQQYAQQDSPCIREIFYSAYEAATLIEALPEPKSVPGNILLWRHQPSLSLCFDHDARLLYASSTSPEGLQDVERMLAGVSGAALPGEVACRIDIPDDTEDAWYEQAVERVREYIAAGDIFQANIARFWKTPCASSQLPALYRRLRTVNPAPFSAWLHIPGKAELTILSASPERLFRIHPDRRVDTRPIAGTRRRDQGARDVRLGDELLLSDKERAEHIMLVDLERNDLGRVCVPGSVHVNECMSIERYATVQHIVSNVCGRLRDDCGLLDVYLAMFPGGTITGCPKIRCMEIIHELEPQGRGPYTGGIGYSAWNGHADMNILIRTFWHCDGMLHWAAGAGIVADSNARHELMETGHKAAGLLNALR